MLLSFSSFFIESVTEAPNRASDVEVNLALLHASLYLQKCRPLQDKTQEGKEVSHAPPPMSCPKVYQTYTLHIIPAYDVPVRALLFVFFPPLQDACVVPPRLALPSALLPFFPAQSTKQFSDGFLIINMIRRYTFCITLLDIIALYIVK